MAIRRSAFARIGKFDTALGPGTLTMASEDMRAFADLLLSGGTIRYQPTAVTHHFHRREYADFEYHLYGYGAGLTAFYTGLLMDKPSLVIPLLRLAPKALMHLRDPEGPRFGGIGSTFPREVLRAHRRGMLKGPALYVASRWKTRKSRRAAI